MKQAMRDAFGKAMVELGEKNRQVWALTADLGSSTRLEEFARRFPERYVNVGVAEANLIGVAAGLALEGMVPFCTSFGVFLPGRCFDQIRVSVCQNNANVKLVGSHAGLSNPGDGASAQSIEDIALMRVLPGMKVICPADGNETRKAVLAAAAEEGPCYLRLSRAETEIVTGEKDEFEIGRARVLREGKKVTIVACGTMVWLALQAAEKIGGEVINLSTIKPLDKETILRSVKKTGKVITVEEHSVIGGMGSAVAEFLGEEYPVPVKKVGIQDRFGQSARDYQQLLEKYGLTVENIIKSFEGLR